MCRSSRPSGSVPSTSVDHDILSSVWCSVPGSAIPLIIATKRRNKREMQWGISAEGLDHLTNRRHILFKNLNYLLFLQFWPDQLKSVLLEVLYIFRIILKTFKCHKLPDNRIPQNVPADSLETHLADQGSLLDTNFEETRFPGSLTIDTSLYATKNVRNLLEIHSTSGPKS